MLLLTQLLRPKTFNKDVVLPCNSPGHDTDALPGVLPREIWEKCDKYALLPENEKGRRQTIVFERTGRKHYEEGGGRARRFDDDGEDVEVYFTKTGTKVHLLRCPALKATDFEKTRKTTICKHCIRMLS